MSDTLQAKLYAGNLPFAARASPRKLYICTSANALYIPPEAAAGSNEAQGQWGRTQQNSCNTTRCELTLSSCSCAQQMVHEQQHQADPPAAAHLEQRSFCFAAPHTHLCNSVCSLPAWSTGRGLPARIGRGGRRTRRQYGMTMSDFPRITCILWKRSARG